ncbi:MAG: hypothetical protein QM638_16285 [Nocardioides sp.]|uniref:hypothetical protein n=1 Tax=Nocardioides sp. TaxID=35761 RepID=UPI0039E21816
MDIGYATTPANTLTAASNESLTAIDWTALAGHAAPAASGYVIAFERPASRPGDYLPPAAA